MVLWTSLLSSTQFSQKDIISERILKFKKKIKARFWLCKILNQDYSGSCFAQWLTAEVSITCSSHLHTTRALEKATFIKHKWLRI